VGPVTPVEVLFRAEKSGPFKGHVTAVIASVGKATFDARGEADCYAHTGQHSTCALGWYLSTRAATLAEYMSLYRELIQIGYAPNIRRARRT
jgi:hypothetical protein